MRQEERMQEIFCRLEERFGPPPAHWIHDPFQLLIATILSQNTSDRNSQRAFLRLKETIAIQPDILANLQPEQIELAIRCAGISNIKSVRIIEVAQEVLRRFQGDLKRVLTLPLAEARASLMDIRGIGSKTADVFLAFIGKLPVMPVDTNIFRVVDRIGFAKGRNYERTRQALEALIPAQRLLDAHLYLIQLGREICKPHKPLCQECPINTSCDYGVALLRKEEVKHD